MTDSDRLHTVLWLVAELNLTRDELQEVREKKIQPEIPPYAFCINHLRFHPDMSGYPLDVLRAIAHTMYDFITASIKEKKA